MEGILLLPIRHEEPIPAILPPRNFESKKAPASRIDGFMKLLAEGFSFETVILAHTSTWYRIDKHPNCPQVLFAILVLICPLCQ
jgi:hypothetical protein